MKRTILPIVFCFGLLSLINFFSLKAYSQNLIVNPSAELPLANGWTIVSGNWQQATGNWAVTVPPFAGNYFFWSGQGATAELYQDINLSDYAAKIDSGIASFTFTGHVRSYPQSPADQSQEIVEYRDANGDTLSVFTSQFNSNTSQWLQVSDTRLAPPTTRGVRIRLISIRHNGTDNDGLHDSLSFTENLVMPIKLISFSMKSSGTVNKLVWQTAQEINSSFFNIQRSINAIVFTTLAKINARGNSNITSTYSYEDNVLNSKASRVYYRLQEVDVDGKSNYSNIISTNTNNSQFIIMPNPAKSIIHISGENVKEIYIIDLTGKQVIHKEINNNYSVDVSRLSKGIYNVSVIDRNGNVQKQKLVIQ